MEYIKRLEIVDAVKYDVMKKMVTDNAYKLRCSNPCMRNGFKLPFFNIYQRCCVAYACCRQSLKSL